MFEMPMALEVVVDTLADEHRRLEETLVRLEILLKAPADRAPLVEAANDLVSCTRTHFRSEENFMRLCGYERLDQHRQEHLRLLLVLTTWLFQFFALDRPFSTEDHSFLVSWLETHITTADQRFVDFLEKRDPSGP